MSAAWAGLPKAQIKKSSSLRVKSDDFRERARYYRFAAALTDVPRDAAMFNDLAAMFDEIADQFGRTETRSA